ncbi:MAG: GNAT family N-acetyltransferase [Candidatus Thorarchaeota archaeon]|jgi:ribosomal protein S18 acetylase RimI-like enzyme
MYDTEVSKLKEADIPEVARLAYEARQSSPHHTEDRTAEGIQRGLEEYSNDDSAMIIQARDDETGRLQGYLTFYAGFPGIAFIDPWNPMVLPGDNERPVAETLIERCKKHARESAIERLEIEYNRLVDSLRPLQMKQSDWYLACDFYRVTDEASMMANLEKVEAPWLEEPEGFELRQLSETDNKEIRNCFFETYHNSKDGLFLDLSPKQQNVSFDWWFNRSRPFNDEASNVILKDTELVAFVVVRPGENEANIGPVGVHPNFRQKGLGKFLMITALNALKRQGIKKASLDVNLKNKAAYNLYSKLGFEQLHTKIFYAWSVK